MWNSPVDFYAIYVLQQKFLRGIKIIQPLQVTKSPPKIFSLIFFLSPLLTSFRKQKKNSIFQDKGFMFHFHYIPLFFFLLSRYPFPLPENFFGCFLVFDFQKEYYFWGMRDFFVLGCQECVWGFCVAESVSQ